MTERDDAADGPDGEQAPSGTGARLTQSQGASAGRDGTIAGKPLAEAEAHVDNAALGRRQHFFADVVEDMHQPASVEKPEPTPEATQVSTEPPARQGAPTEPDGKGSAKGEPQPTSSSSILDYDALVQMQKASAQHTTFGQRARASLVVAFVAVAGVALFGGVVVLVLERGFTRPQPLEWEHPETQRRRKQAEVEGQRKRQADELWRRAYALPAGQRDQADKGVLSDAGAPSAPGTASAGGEVTQPLTRGSTATEQPRRLASDAPSKVREALGRPGAGTQSADEGQDGIVDIYELYAKADREKVRVGRARPSSAGPGDKQSKQIPVDGIRLQARLIEDAANDVGGAEIIAVLIEDASLGPHRLPRGTEIHGQVTGATRTHRITAEFTLLRDKQRGRPPIRFTGRARGQDGRVGIPGKQILGKEAAESVGVAAASEGLRSLVRSTTGVAGEVIDDTARAATEKGAEKAQRLDQDAIVVMAKANTAFEVYVHSVQR